MNLEAGGGRWPRSEWTGLIPAPGREGPLMGRMPTQAGQGNIKALPAIHVSHGSEAGSPREQEQVTGGSSRDPDSGTEPDRSLGRAEIQGPYLPGGIQHAVSRLGTAVGLHSFQKQEALSICSVARLKGSPLPGPAKMPGCAG